MAQRVQVILTDDLDGGQAVETVSFGVDGTSYEIDLSAKNATRLRKALEPFVAVARAAEATSPVTISHRRGPSAQNSSPISSKAVRVWAKSHRIKVSPRGRVPAAVVERFRQAGN